MEIKNLKIDKSKLDINNKFYFILKTLVKTKLTASQIGVLLGVIYKNIDRETTDLIDEIQISLELLCKPTPKNPIPQKIVIFEQILIHILDKVDIHLLSFSLKLIAIKDPLLSEAKLTETIVSAELETLDQLSLEYDNKSVMKPYATRVNGALLSLLLFDKIEKSDVKFISSSTNNFCNKLVEEAKKLCALGLEPNQIFMLMFSESINQSIISDSGSNYEDRILKTLINIGIDRKSIQKVHDKADASTEYDFFFELEGITYGIGAKRTLRERYKQFIKTALSSKIDVTIEFTLGLDLNSEKTKTITNHNTYLFVANEVYEARDFLQTNPKVFSVKDFTLENLKNLAHLSI